MNSSEICDSTIGEETLCLEIDAFGGERRRNEPQVLSEPRTILLVEDEAFVREVTSEVLRAAGYRVLTAKDAAEAGQIFEHAGHEVDLLLTDVILPGENGRVLAERLKRGNPRLQVLLATGYGEQMGRESGECCLAKPFSSGELLARVQKSVETGRRRSEAPLCRLAPASGLQNLTWNVA